MRLANIRQRIGRYDRRARAAGEREDWDAQLRYIDLLDRDVAAYEAATTRSTPTATPAAALSTPAAAVAVLETDTRPSRAGEFTIASTLDLSDDDLEVAYRALDDDPAAQEAILDIWAWREDMARARDAEIAAHQEQQQREDAERAAASIAAAEDDASPLTNPTRRRERRLSPEKQCREEYDAHTYTAYIAAEGECRGQMLNREGLAKGIDPHSLFSGPAARARKYASEELRTWWARNGRVTYAEWKYQWFGRDGDKAAAQTARHQSLGETTA